MIAFMQFASDTIVMPDAWVIALTPAIPVLSAFAVKREGSNQQRAIIAIVASVMIAGWSVLTQDGGATGPALIGALLTTLIGQAGSYQMLQGVLGDIDLNDLAPSFGIGGTVVDD